jgi:RimJ/RimL family protein N-acetyltransferase
MSAMSSHWPLFDLVIRTERLELRLPTDADLEEMADLAARGVHDPSWMPFLFPWTRRPSPDLERGLLQYHWRKRAEWTPDAWALELGVFRDGEVVGCQEIGATEFAITRCVTTGSWLGQAHQGKGLGKEMRLAVLALAFDHLGATRAESGAYIHNHASLGVSRSIGYVDDGLHIRVTEGQRQEEQRLAIDLDGWRSRERPPVAVSGLDACRDLFGI